MSEADAAYQKGYDRGYQRGREHSAADELDALAARLAETERLLREVSDGYERLTTNGDTFLEPANGDTIGHCKDCGLTFHKEYDYFVICGVCWNERNKVRPFGYPDL